MVSSALGKFLKSVSDTYAELDKFREFLFKDPRFTPLKAFRLIDVVGHNYISFQDFLAFFMRYNSQPVLSEKELQFYFNRYANVEYNNQSSPASIDYESFLDMITPNNDYLLNKTFSTRGAIVDSKIQDETVRQDIALAVIFIITKEVEILRHIDRLKESLLYSKFPETMTDFQFVYKLLDPLETKWITYEQMLLFLNNVGFDYCNEEYDHLLRYFNYDSDEKIISQAKFVDGILGERMTMLRAIQPPMDFSAVYPGIDINNRTTMSPLKQFLDSTEKKLRPVHEGVAQDDVAKSIYYVGSQPQVPFNLGESGRKTIFSDPRQISNNMERRRITSEVKKALDKNGSLIELNPDVVQFTESLYVTRKPEQPQFSLNPSDYRYQATGMSVTNLGSKEMNSLLQREFARSKNISVKLTPQETDMQMSLRNSVFASPPR